MKNKSKLLYLFVILAMLAGFFPTTMPGSSVSVVRASPGIGAITTVAGNGREETAAPTLQGAAFFGGSGDQRGTGIAVSGGALHVVGNVQPESQTSGDTALLLRYAIPDLSSPVSRTVGSGTTFYGVAATSEGVYAGGYNYSLTNDPVGGKEVKTFLAKFSPDGTNGTAVGGSLWATGGPGNLGPLFVYSGVENFEAVATAVEGSSTVIYAAGGGQPCSYGTYIIAKYNSSGNFIGAATDSSVGVNFNQCYIPSNGGSGSRGVTLLNGNIYVSGVSNWPHEDSSYRPAIWKYGPSLNLIWRRKDTSLSGDFKGVTALANAIYAVGYTTTATAGEDYLIEKYDESGNLTWRRISGGAGQDRLMGVVAIGSRLFAAGFTTSSGAGGADAVILEIDPATGATLSTTLYGGAQDDKANGMATDGTDLYVVGESRSFAQGGNAVGSNDVMLLRYRPAAPAAKNWTFMVYMAADNDLDTAALDDLNEMEMVGSSDNVSIVALLDRYGNNNTYLYYVISDNNTSVISSPPIAGVFPAEVNMGDPNTLITFVNWARANYPATHYALVLWDHGSGWRSSRAVPPPIKGVCFDYTGAAVDYLTTLELGNALYQLFLDAGNTRLDIVGFDACLMGMLEIGHQIANWIEMMVASEEVVPIDGWPYDTILRELVLNPGSSLQTLSTTIVNKYRDYYSGAYGTGIETMSAIRPRSPGCLELSIHLRNLADSLRASGEWVNIVTARTLTECFYNPDFVDLYHFAQNIKAISANTTVQNNAQQVMDQVNKATDIDTIHAEWHGSYHPNAHGLSIHFPICGLLDPVYATLSLSVDQTWDEFLTWYLTARPPAWTQIISDPVEGVNPDIVGVDSSLTASTSIALRVRTQATIDFSNFQAISFLNTDQNIGTGYLPSNFGAEYMVYATSGSAAGSGGGFLSGLDMKLKQGTRPFASLVRWGGEHWEIIAPLAFYSDNFSFWTIVPLALLGPDEGNMDVVQYVGTLTPEEWTDRAPNPPVSWFRLIDDGDNDGAPGGEIFEVEAFRWPDRVGFRVWGQFNFSNFRAITHLDVDQNSATGKPDRGLGLDYIVQVISAPLEAFLQRWNSANATWDFVAPVTIYTDNASYFWYEILLSQLGNDQGNMDVFQNVGTRTQWTDNAPDADYRSIGEPRWSPLILDPAGDQFGGVGPDMTGVDVYRKRDMIQFRVRANGMDFANLKGSTFIDVDRNPATGYSANLTNDIGADYLAVITTNTADGTMPRLTGTLFRWTGMAWENVTGLGIFTDGNYYWFGIKYSNLVNPNSSPEEGDMDVVQALGTLTPDTATDKAPNTGHGTIVTRATLSQSIADGVTWLAARQNANGSWGTMWPVAKTGLAVLKLATHATSANLSPFDPGYQYRAQVEAGLNYIFANAHTTNITAQPAGNPDTNGNGLGVYFYTSNVTAIKQHFVPIYETSIVMMAIAASQAPARTVNLAGSPVNGWTYQQVLRDAVDYMAWAQTDSGYGRGGWDYQPKNNAGDRSDQSNSGWATLGLAYAESPPPIGFSLPIPGFVRSELDIWINYIQNPVDGDEHDGGADYDGPIGGHDLWVNMLKTGNLLQQMAFVGDTLASPRVQAAINYVVRHWNDANSEPGWRGYPSNYHATYTLMKGLEAFKLDTITSGNITINWLADFAANLLYEQNPDGSWPYSSFDDGEQILSTEWALLTLQKVTAPTIEKPDLVIERAYGQWLDATHYRVYCRVRNRGNASSPTTNVTEYVDGVIAATAGIVGLAPGEITLLFSFSQLTWDGARHQIRVCADSGNAVDELNEDNNCFTFYWPPKHWTVMVYMCADNELDGRSWQEMNEMEMAGSTDNVSIIVLRDGSGNGNSDIWYIQHDTDMGRINSPVVNYLGEVNMGDNQTLVNFVKWTIANYPAERYALILWDTTAHYGAAWRGKGTANTRGVCVDYTSGSDYLTTPEIASALGTILTETGIVPNLLGFDVSLMGLFEVAYELEPHLAQPGEHVILASQEMEPEDGWAYHLSLVALTNNSTMTATDWAKRIVSDYVSFYTSQGWQYPTLSAISITVPIPCNVTTLGTAISNFAQAMMASTEPDKRTKIKTARDGAERFWFNVAHAPYVDLYDFAQRVKAAVSDNVVQSAAQAVMDAATRAVVGEGHGANHTYAHGISIYYPTCREMYASDYTGTYLAFTRDTNWDEFLNWILEPDTTPPPAPTLVSPANGTLGAAPAPLLKWNQVGDASAVRYNLQVTDVADNATFSSPVVNITDFRTRDTPAFYRVTPPLNPGTYCWRVQAVDGANNSGAWSEVWWFKVYWQAKWSYTFQPAINRMLFGQSVGIANLGVNTKGGEPDAHLEIATGSDECSVYNPELDTWVAGVWRVFDAKGNVEWARDTQSDQSRSSVAIADLNGDGNLEVIGGTTSGETVEVMDRFGTFVWTFPTPPRRGNMMWHSSPAVADVNPAVSGLEVIIGNRPLHTIFCFDGDNSDRVNDGLNASTINWSTIGEGTNNWEGTEGIDWDILWIFTASGQIVSTPAVADIDRDGQLEVVFGAGVLGQGPADGKIYCLNGATGALKWSYQTGAEAIVSSAGLADFDNDGDLEVVVGASDGKVYFINNNGDATILAAEVTTFQTGGPVPSSPSIGDVDGDGLLEVIIGSTDKNVYCLAYNPVTSTVTEKWRSTTGGAVYSSAALAQRIAGNEVVIASTGKWDMYTHLLVARPEFTSIEALLAGRTAKIALPALATASHPYTQAAMAALNTYSGNYTFVNMPFPEHYQALQTGTIDAALYFFSRHPMYDIGRYISELGCKLLPWSSSAVNAVTSQFPRALATQLPANTYSGQMTALPGYALRHWLDVYIGSEDGKVRILDGVSGARMDEFPAGVPIRSSPCVADIDGNGRLEVIFADWSPIPASFTWRSGGSVQTRAVTPPSYWYEGSGDILWCFTDGKSDVGNFTSEWPMFRGGATRTGLYSRPIQAVQPGDANCDGMVNALDITKVERIIAGLDPPGCGADANLDGYINAIDITKVERIIVGLP